MNAATEPQELTPSEHADFEASQIAIPPAPRVPHDFDWLMTQHRWIRTPKAAR